MKKIVLIILLSILTVTSGCGFTTRALRHDIGYADLRLPSHRNIDRELGLNIGPTLVKTASRFIPKEDLEDIRLLKHVDGVRVAIYKVNNEDAVVRSSIEATATKLKATGWETLVSVNEEEERVVIMARMEGDILYGVVVLVTDKAEAVFLNLIGRIEPQDFDALVALAQR